MPHEEEEEGGDSQGERLRSRWYIEEKPLFDDGVGTLVVFYFFSLGAPLLLPPSLSLGVFALLRI